MKSWRNQPFLSWHKYAAPGTAGSSCSWPCLVWAHRPGALFTYLGGSPKVSWQGVLLGPGQPGVNHSGST
eukprot:1159546-Pelagomonas_calceolata.AAC.7